MKSNKKKLIILLAAAFLILVIGITYAFFAINIGPDALTNINIFSKTTDNLYFTNGPDISLRINQVNLAEGGTNVEAITNSSATLKANNKTNSATDTYNVYFQITKNEYQYSSYGTPEILLTIIKPDGTPVTVIDDCNYVTSGGVSGFDITTKTGLLKVAEDYSITSTNTTIGITQNWTFKVTYLNLTIDQGINEDKELLASVKMQKEKKFSDITLSFVGNSHPYYTNYNVNSDCTSSSSTFNIKDWSLNIDFNSRTNCTINYTLNTDYPYFNDYIKTLVGTIQGTGKLVNENGYRYEGKDPNNYVFYNGEMWRIIGVFGNEVHGQTGDLIKLIKMDSIGALVWHYSSGVSWSDSSLKSLLDNYYYTGIDYPYNYNSSSNYCSTYYGSYIAMCNYSDNGIKNDFYRNMIQQVRWNNTAYTSADIASRVYSNDIISTTFATGNIGLMYLSDYGYAVLEDVCERNISLSNYTGTTNGQTCVGQNWLSGQGYEWTISYYNSLNAWRIYDNGAPYGGGLFYGFMVRPTIFLKNSVYYLNGNGTYSNPYIIGM